MRNAMAIGVVAVLSASVAADAFGANQVLVTTGSVHAQGVTHASGSLCYVITAGHVVGAGEKLSVMATSGERYEVELVHKSPLDVAVLIVLGTKDGSGPCGPREDGALIILESLDEVIERQKTLYISTVTERGVAVRTPVDLLVVSKDRLLVRPRSSSEGFSSGSSGSALFAEGTLLGLLLSVRDGGEGEIIRIDYARSSLQPFLDWSNPCFPPCELSVKEAEVIDKLRFAWGYEVVYRLPSHFPAPPYLHMHWANQGRTSLGVRSLTELRTVTLSYSSRPTGYPFAVVSSQPGQALDLDNFTHYRWGRERYLFEVVHARGDWWVRITPYELLGRDAQYMMDGEDAAFEPREPASLAEMWHERESVIRKLEFLLEKIERQAAYAGRLASECEACLQAEQAGCDACGRLREEKERLTVLHVRAEDLRNDKNWVQAMIERLLWKDVSDQTGSPGESEDEVPLAGSPSS